MQKLISALCLIFCLVMLCCAPIALGEESESIVYYNPDSGKYYHAKPDCETMSSEYHALMQPISEDELAWEPYSFLKRCMHCFGREQWFKKPEDGTMEFHYESNYATAPEGFLLDKAGDYTCGSDFPAGIYTIHSDGVNQGEVCVYATDGRLLHTFVVTGRNSASFYFSDGMRLTLPEGLTMQAMIHVARFQTVLEVTDITSARYFMLLECPGRKYCVQRKPGEEGSLILYNMDAEMGNAEPQYFILPQDQPVTIDLSGLYNYFVELHNCLIWYTDAGVG
ncbi:MAG: hypothetical protein E7323_04380 [Clostridiales bacterium]|nr:hypothetical protein [Clostridiales bacterium]